MTSPRILLQNYKAALEEAVAILSHGPDRPSAEDERLDALLQQIHEHPAAFSESAASSENDSVAAHLTQLRAHVEAFVRRRADQEASTSVYPHREHGIGPTLGQQT